MGRVGSQHAEALRDSEGRKQGALSLYDLLLALSPAAVAGVTPQLRVWLQQTVQKAATSHKKGLPGGSSVDVPLIHGFTSQLSVPTERRG